LLPQKKRTKALGMTLILAFLTIVTFVNPVPAFASELELNGEIDCSRWLTHLLRQESFSVNPYLTLRESVNLNSDVKVLRYLQRQLKDKVKAQKVLEDFKSLPIEVREVILDIRVLADWPNFFKYLRVAWRQESLPDSDSLVAAYRKAKGSITVYRAIALPSADAAIAIRSRGFISTSLLYNYDLEEFRKILKKGVQYLIDSRFGVARRNVKRTSPLLSVSSYPQISALTTHQFGLRKKIGLPIYLYELDIPTFDLLRPYENDWLTVPKYIKTASDLGHKISVEVVTGGVNYYPIDSKMESFILGWIPSENIKRIFEVSPENIPGGKDTLPINTQNHNESVESYVNRIKLLYED
jgi:hypothetical protein